MVYGRTTIYKLLDPDTDKIMLIGITNRSSVDTIKAIMKEGSITNKANEIIQAWIEKGITPKIILSHNSVGKRGVAASIRDLGTLLEAVVVEESLKGLHGYEMQRPIMDFDAVAEESLKGLHGEE